MKKKKTIASLFLSIILVVVGTPIATIDSSLALKTASAAPSCSQFGNLNPITDLSLISALAPPPEGATYACGELSMTNSFIYHFFDANDKFLGKILKPNPTDSTGHTYVTDSSGKVINDIGAPAYCDFENDWGPFFDAGCWMQFLGALISSLFLSLGIVILEIAGYLFNYLLDYTIIQFSTAIYDKIASAVETAWTAFRDIANILIIGIFTFIALSIILGLKEFGQKKLIANVLIIAVLINFSLLFTKMIIDASNFTALQFYNAALGQVSNTAGPSISIETGKAGAESKTGAIVESSSKGISGQFMQAIGITGVANSLEQIRAEQKRTDSGLLGIAFGLLAFIFFVGAAVVLFYGSFLLIARVVLLIFLMITSSLAFASYLVPKWAGSSYGWSTWWSSLLKSAVFAPMLMLFLWITLQIAQKLAVPSKTATLGGVVDNPDGNVAAVFSYLIILGLLFLSFKLSSTFAGKISGFNLASIATALPLTLGSRLAGFGLRKVGLGELGYRYQKSKEREARDYRNKAMVQEKLGNFGEARKFEKLAAKKLKRAELGGKFADSKFNLMNTGAAKVALGAVGVTGFAAGASSKDAKGFASRVKADAEAAEKRARPITVSGDDEKGLRERAADDIRRSRQEERERKQADRENAEKTVKAIHESATEEKKAFQESLKTATKTLSEHQNAAVESEKRYADELKGVVERGGGTEDIAKVRAGRESELLQEKANIERAKREAEKHDASIAAIDSRIAPNLQKAEKELDQIDKDLKNLDEKSDATKAVMREAGDAMVAAAKESAQNIAGEVGKQQGLIRTAAQREYVSKEVRNKFKTNVGSAGIRQVLEEYVKKESDGRKTEDSSGGKGGGH